MCGIFYILSKNKININDTVLHKFIKKIKYRGPDYTNIVRDQFNIYIHTLLAIQGHNPQPYKDNNNYLLFNGEIYGTSSLEESINSGSISYKNIPDNFNSESEFLIDYFKKYNFKKLENLDGEFVINYIDKEKNWLHIITDPFGTKPFCFYKDSNYLIASSYESCVKNAMNYLNLTGKIQFVIPNTHYVFNLNTYEKVYQSEIIKWDFNPRYSNYNRWNCAFENSIKKRTNTDKGIFIPLSSGYDSGCIVSSMIKLNKKFETYTFKGQEDPKILETRKEYIHASGNSFFYINPKSNIENKYREYCNRIEDYTAYHIDGSAYSNIYNAYSCFGIYQIFQKAREDNQIIFLSGHGGDEIFSDYGNIENRKSSVLNLDYTNVRSKWPNFDSAYGRNIIQMFERVAGCYGIESRYPFLDKQVVQEFLWLSDTLKNSEFKQCISQYMRKLNFPFLANKKCSVRVITEDEGGNNYFKNMVPRILKEENISTPVYSNYIKPNINKYRPNLNYKPKISYYP